MDQSVSTGLPPGVSITRQKMASHLMDANRQWANRPDDERFRSLQDLRQYIEGRQESATVFEGPLKLLRAAYTPSGGLQLVAGSRGEFTPTNWAFAQFCRAHGAPPGYLSTLPAHIATDILNFEAHRAADQNVKLLVGNGASPQLRALTSPKYGRIWDLDILNQVERLVDRDPRWHVPPAWGNKPAGLYASDRDMFIFMVDGGSVIEEPEGFGHRPSQLHRGFIVSNSEVGRAAFRLMTFLFRVVCGNHIVWDAKDITTLTIRHTKGGPERFAQESGPMLKAYADSTASGTVDGIRRAMNYMLPKPDGTGSTSLQPIIEWLCDSPAKLTTSEAFRTIEMARAEEGDCRTLWQAVNGISAVARDLDFVEARDDLQRRGAKLMKLVRS